MYRISVNRIFKPAYPLTLLKMFTLNLYMSVLYLEVNNRIFIYGKSNTDPHRPRHREHR